MFTLGFHEDVVERRLHVSRAIRGEAIRVFTCQPVSPGVKRAFESLRARAYALGVSEPELIPLPCHDFPEAVYVVRKNVRGLSEPVIADLSGGMRLAVVAVYTGLILEKKRFTLYLQSETSGVDVEVPCEFIELMWNKLSREEERLLKTIVALGETDIKELSRILGKKEKTIANQLSKLRRHKLVAKKGRKPTIYPTKWAKALTPPETPI